MLGVIATVKAKEGQTTEFLQVAMELVKQVNTNEPGCLFYELFQSEEANTYVFVERYVDQAAVDAHRASEHFTTLVPVMRAHMNGGSTVQRLKQIDGQNGATE